MLEFIIKVVNEASDYFTKTIKNSLEIEKVVSSEKIKKLEATIHEVEENAKTEKANFSNKIAQLESSKSDLEAK